MLKVVIADDEERICQLIRALVDWENMGMTVVAFASNGLEAVDLVRTWNPDILITDIRMPGYDGLQVIEKVKNENKSIEVIIISGFAHFPYAQTAIKFGVGDYLLKPINKNEINQTLHKLGAKIRARQESESDMQQLMEDSQTAKNQMKIHLINDLLEQETLEYNLSVLHNKYHLEVQEGVFQTFCIKIDCDLDTIGASAMNIVFEKVRDIIFGNLQSLCYEIVLDIRDCCGYGILNYHNKKQTDVKRVLRDCLNQLVIQKSMLGSVKFTLSVGMIEKEPSGLKSMLAYSRQMLDERIIYGAERLIEVMPKE